MKANNIKYIQLSDLHGKQPPYDLELEKVVLGSVMLEKHALAEVIDFILPDVFYDPKHIEICRAIQKLYIAKQPIDILTVNAQLRADKMLTFVGGSFYVASLTNRVGSTANIKYHTLILCQKSVQRKLIVLGNELVEGGYNDSVDPFELLTSAENGVKSINLTYEQSANDILTFQDLLKQELEMREKVAKGGANGVKVGIKSIDDYLNGFAGGTLTVIAARPGLGKSVLAINISKGVAKQKKSVAVFNYEMNNVQYTQRMIADECGIDLELIKKAQEPDNIRNEINATMGRLANMHLYLDGNPTNTLRSLRTKLSKLKQTVGLDMIVIDYLQIMPTPELPPNTNENARIEYLSRNLKLIAKEFDVPVIVLSQLNREVENNYPYKPGLKHLRSSGAIEQDADYVFFIWRPAYYQKLYGKEILDEMGNAYPHGYTLLDMAKARDAEPEKLELAFNGAYQRFYDPNTSGGITPNTNFDEQPF